jgi:hypothetical protein
MNFNTKVNKLLNIICEIIEIKFWTSFAKNEYQKLKNMLKWLILKLTWCQSQVPWSPNKKSSVRQSERLRFLHLSCFIETPSPLWRVLLLPRHFDCQSPTFVPEDVWSYFSSTPSVLCTNLTQSLFSHESSPIHVSNKLEFYPEAVWSGFILPFSCWSFTETVCPLSIF